MKRYFYLFLVVASFAVTLAPTDAFAQSAACNSARAQLAALDRSGSGNGRSRQFEAAARRQNSELQRTVNYARQLGCDRGGGLFGSALPPECGTINAQIGRMRANLSSLEAQAESLGGSDTGARRQQLLASIDRNCNAAPIQARPQQPRGLLETLFGGGEPTPPQPVPVQPALRASPSDAFPPNSMPDLDGQVAEDEDAEVREKRRYGGSRAVCVRTCDGYFFPVNVLPDGRSGANEMCQALCPGTETQAFFMSGSGDIEGSVSVEGKGYTSLANASKYQKSFDPTCGCRKTGQSWAEALRDAEELLDRRKGDIFVTQAKSDELSRGGIVEKKSDKKKGKGKPESIDTLLNSGDNTGTTTVSDPAAAEAATGAAAPTASQESSGIGPQTITGLSVTGKSDGKTVEVSLPSGEKRMVRVIGTGQQPR